MLEYFPLNDIDYVVLIKQPIKYDAGIINFFKERNNVDLVMSMQNAIYELSKERLKL